MIGGLLALVDQALRGWMTVEVASVLVIVLLVLLTRGLHQDGLADTIDGLAGGRTVEDRLRIMRDPSVRALGATGLFLSLLLRYAGLLAVPQAWRVPVLLCMPAVGRWAMVCVACASPYARRDGGWQRHSSRISRGGMCWSRLWWWPWSSPQPWAHGRPWPRWDWAPS